MDKKVRIAVAGICGFGGAHVRGVMAEINADQAELVGVCDIKEDAVKAMGEKYHVPYTTDFDELIARDDVDAVILALPDQIHAEFAIKALKAGKHVLCEKPMALELDDCKKMVKAADEADTYLMVGQICRFTPAFVQAKKMVDEGEIGELFFVEGEYAHDYAHIQTPWRKDPKAPRHGMVGGGCHSVDLLRWVAGNPTEVFAYSNHKMLPDWPTDDCTIAVMQFPNNVIGKVFCSTGCKRDYTMRTLFYGSKGTIIVDNRNSTFSVFREDIAEGREVKIECAINNHAAELEIDQFCKCILTNTPPAINSREGATTVSICSAILQSAKEHKPVSVDYDF